MMLGTTRALHVYAYGAPCDMRKSFDTLALLVQRDMGRELTRGDVFLFVGKTRRRAKALFYDGTGLCLYAKRLEAGRFAAVWEREVLELTLSELALFFEGGDVRRRRAPAPGAALPVFALARSAAHAQQQQQQQR
jgi:transposase